MDGQVGTYEWTGEQKWIQVNRHGWAGGQITGGHHKNLKVPRKLTINEITY